MIKKIEIDGLLSFDKFELEMNRLNVLIGPNGSGKSNLIEVLSLLQALPTDIGEPIRRGGGIGAWLRSNGEGSDEGSVITHLHDGKWHYAHSLRIRNDSGRYSLCQETLEKALVSGGIRGVTNKKTASSSSRHSMLSPPLSTEVTKDFGCVANEYVGIRLYKNWSFGNPSPARSTQPADQPVEFLEEDFTNLALVMQNTFINSGVERVLNEEFKRFFERFQRFTVSIFGNQVLLYMHEEGLSEPVPATRWSDGMLRYLSLLAILCHPNPPGLICIDEPDLGLHPDILPNLARLIKSTSERTQVIITTHSKDLIDQFSDRPDVVVVCERDSGGATRMRRLDAKKLEKWLEDYSLGQLWVSGEIGGTRF
jgi:predicted ATPase